LVSIDDVVDAEPAGQIQPVGIDVGDDDLARADGLGDQRAHDADRPGAGHQHVLADQVEGQRGVDGIAERIEDRGDLVGHVVGDGDDIVRRQRDIFGEVPGRCTPTPSVLRQRCPLPARQLRHWPQTIWPSPETRWPTGSP
jgi:hypothetical protein